MKHNQQLRSSTLRKKTKNLLRKCIACYLAASIFVPTLCQADGLEAAAPDVGIHTENNVPVVDIARPNDKGLSHNKFLEFNVGPNGLILNNNAAGTFASQLAGPVGQNMNLNGAPASLILNEVTGPHITHLNGMLEVAGQRADVIIANPSGIVGNGFGFINVNRATLVTGTPNIADGNLNGFTVAGGNVQIEGLGMKERTLSKLDILTRAAKINAELWAKDEINIVTGQNEINYKTLTATTLEPDAAEKPALSLDIAALGGMYAGKIRLVGTEKGLGVNAGGEIAAGEKLTITSEGKVTFIRNSKEETDEDGKKEPSYTGITSGGSIEITGQAIENNTSLSAKDELTLTAAETIQNHGQLEAGAPYQANEADEESPVIQNTAGLTLTSGQTITAMGSIEASGKLKLSGKTVTYGKAALSGANIEIEAEKTDVISDTPKEPDVKQEPGKEPVKAPEAVETTGPRKPELIPGPAETISKAKQDNLPITADSAAGMKNRPVIDRAANDVPLIQIAETDGKGISKNHYTDFNINQSGLILNNATEYTKTQLGGYIDRNSRLAGDGAKIILNEITSANPSYLNGYLEVAGHKADVIIANPNGLTANGFGLINAASATIAAANPLNGTFAKNKSNITIEGFGINAGQETALKILGENINIDQSEIWGQNLTLTADGKLKNTGKITAEKDISLTADELANEEKGYISAQENIEVNAGQLKQNSAALIAKGDIKITANEAQNKAGSIIKSENINAKLNKLTNEGSAILAEKQLDLTADKILNETAGAIESGQTTNIQTRTLTNENAAIRAGENLTVNVDTLENKNQALLIAGKDMDITAKETIKNKSAAATSKNTLSLQANNMENSGQAILEGKEITLSLSEKITNDGSAITATEGLTITANETANQNKGGLYGQTISIEAQKDITNSDALIAANKNLNLSAQNIFNKEEAILYAGDNIKLAAKEQVLNQSSTIESQGDIAIKANRLANEKTTFETGWDVSDQMVSYAIEHWGGDYYRATRTYNRNIHTGVIREETEGSSILAGGNIEIGTENLENKYSKIMAGNDLDVTAGTIENHGYQGTIIIADRGNDEQYWKYKKHRKLHIGCKMKYGSTIVPYAYDETKEEPVARLGIMSAGNKVNITADKIDNKTYNAGKQEIGYKTITQSPVTVNGPEDKLKISADWTQTIKGINDKIYTIQSGPKAKYLIETNEKYAAYQNFLSSDYLLNRVKSDPEKVMKRLGDGYFEQKLVTEQIMNLTGRRFLDGYTSDYEQYKALLENGAVAAEKMDLRVGIALTKEQIASLTADIVWLVEKEINGQKVLVPEIYLSSLKEGDLTESGAIIAGTDIELYAKEDLKNLGTIKADNKTKIQAQNITNQAGTIKGKDIDLTAEKTIANLSGKIEAQNEVKITAEDIINKTRAKTTNYKELTQTELGQTAQITSREGNIELTAKQDIKNESANLSAGKELNLTAGNNIEITAAAKEKHVAVVYSKSSAEIGQIKHQASELMGQNIHIEAGNDLKLENTYVEAKEEASLKAGNNIEITAKKDLDLLDTASGKRGEHYTRDRSVDETIAASVIGAGKDLNIEAGADIKIKGSQTASEAGKTSLAAKGDITIENETEKHERLHEEERQKVGILSSTTTKIYDHQTVEEVKSSYIGGKEIETASGKDTNITGSMIIADKDITIKAGKDINIKTAEEKSQSEYKKETKKSGILGGGGLGFTIGSQKQKDTYENGAVEQIGSTIGSIGGNISIKSEKETLIKGSDIIAGKDIEIQGENVRIESAENTYTSKEKHEFEQKGISVSLGSNSISALENVASPIKRAGQVEDERLKALYAYKANKEIKENGEALKNIGKEKINISVSIGSSKSESTSESQTVTNQGSNITAQGDIKITATEKDIEIKGSQIEGKNIDLKAKENIRIEAAKNNNATNEETSNSAASIGVNLTTWGIEGNINQSKGNVKENGTSYEQSKITAREELKTETGKDTNIIGSKLEGEKVEMKVGGNLNIESLQDKETYDEKTSSAGIGFSGSGITGSINKGKTDSNYESVTKQAGIYAGKDGFDIYVEDNTDLKGAVIASQAEKEKNKLSTGTLTYGDIENKAEYSSSNVGTSYDSKEYQKDDPNYKNQGLPPVISTEANGSGDSTTKAAIAQGEIEIRNNPSQDISDLSRDTNHALNQLEKIFDKKKIEEQKELANIFGEEIFKAIGDIGLKEGSPEKAALEAFAGGMMSKLGGGSFAEGAMSAGVTQLVINELKNIKDPALLQWAAAIVGAAAAKAIGKSPLTGASIAISEVKNNHLGEGHNSPPVQVGVGVKDVGLGHVSLVIMNEDGTFEEGNYGRYLGVNTIPLIGMSPVGSGTYLINNTYYPYSDHKDVYMLNVNAIDANEVEYIYNHTIDSNGYKRENIDNTVGGIEYKYYYKLPGNQNDYKLWSNNCTTTTLDAIAFGYFSGNKEANDTLYLLKHAIAPDQVNWILKWDYEKYKGKGLVTGIIG